MQKGKIEKIKIFHTKGQPGETVQKVQCTADCGLEGDRFAKGGDKQLTMIDDICENWLCAQHTEGLCFKRYKANITAANIDISAFKAGQKLKIGTAVLEFSPQSKECFAECIRVEQKMDCLLRTHAKYLKVAQSGTISVDDEINTEE